MRRQNSSWAPLLKFYTLCIYLYICIYSEGTQILQLTQSFRLKTLCASRWEKWSRCFQSSLLSHSWLLVCSFPTGLCPLWQRTQVLFTIWPAVITELLHMCVTFKPVLTDFTQYLALQGKSQCILCWTTVWPILDYLTTGTVTLAHLSWGISYHSAKSGLPEPVLGRFLVLPAWSG